MLTKESSVKMGIICVNFISSKYPDNSMLNFCFCLDGGYLVRGNGRIEFHDDFNTPISLKRIRSADYTENYDIILSYNYSYTKKPNSKRYDIKRDQVVLSYRSSSEEIRKILQERDLFWKEKSGIEVIPDEELELIRIHNSIEKSNNFRLYFHEYQLDLLEFAGPKKSVVFDTVPIHPIFCMGD